MNATGVNKNLAEIKKLPPEQTLPDMLEKSVPQYTVFLVEDDSDDRMQAVHILRKSPYVYNVHTFESGDQLIRHFDGEGYYNHDLMRYIPTLVMLDIHIPGINGLDILKMLKKNERTRNIPTIIMTGDMSDKLVIDAHKLGADAYIRKPLDLDQIHEVIYA